MATTSTVTLNEAPIRALITQRITAALDRLQGPIPHTSHDYTWSPARWDVDQDRTIRHTLTTLATLTRTPTGLTLTYTIHPITYPPGNTPAPHHQIFSTNMQTFLHLRALHFRS